MGVKELSGSEGRVAASLAALISQSLGKSSLYPMRSCQEGACLLAAMLGRATSNQLQAVWNEPLEVSGIQSGEPSSGQDCSCGDQRIYAEARINSPH